MVLIAYSQATKRYNKMRITERLRVPISLALIVAGLWFINAIVLYGDSNRGTFGDMFGAVNALFSGLAFAGVIYAILLQREELMLQRKELSQTRSVFEKQARLQLRQTFEPTFFQLLDQQSKITNSIRLGNNAEGRECFGHFSTRVHEFLEKLSREHTGDELEKIGDAYARFYENEQHIIGHYFRGLYNIMKFIDNGDIDDKRLYTNLVRSQLSSFELVLLFYNGLGYLGRDKMKPMIEKYALLKHLPKDKLNNPDKHLGLYSPTAFE